MPELPLRSRLPLRSILVSEDVFQHLSGTGAGLRKPGANVLTFDEIVKHLISVHAEHCGE